MTRIDIDFGNIILAGWLKDIDSLWQMKERLLPASRTIDLNRGHMRKKKAQLCDRSGFLQIDS